ncbi:MAG: D-2-hydroxyacid dehydrogenase [Halobacteriaceae archaeon]
MPADVVAVLPQTAHGIPAAEYADELRERLPDREVRLARHAAAVPDVIADATVVTGREFDEDLLAAAPELKLFAAVSAGVNHLPLEAMAERGVTVTNAAGVHGPNMAEHVIGWLLTFARRHHEGWRRQQRREWRRYQSFGELQGSTVTVVGLGAIGEAVVERLAGFGVDTIGVRYTPAKGGPTDEVIGFEHDALHDVLSRTDYLVLACPLTETTRGLVDADALESLPMDAVVVNVGRGPIVDTDALVAALRANELEGAALDVTDPEPLPAEHPLWGFENVLITPHSSGHTPHYFARRADILADNLARVAETGSYRDLRNQVAP